METAGKGLEDAAEMADHAKEAVAAVQGTKRPADEQDTPAPIAKRPRPEPAEAPQSNERNPTHEPAIDFLMSHSEHAEARTPAYSANPVPAPSTQDAPTPAPAQGMFGGVIPGMF